MDTTHSGPSEKAIEAGRMAACLPRDALRTTAGRGEDAVRAAHHPALGLDRSVCLRDVVEALREHRDYPNVNYSADFIEREFGDTK